jgi:hypothetical protein
MVSGGIDEHYGASSCSDPLRLLDVARLAGKLHRAT